MKKKEKDTKDLKNKENIIRNFFEKVGEQNGFGSFNIHYNWFYHCGLIESEVRVLQYILNFTLNGKLCLSRKEVIAFNLNMHPKTVERAISSLREKEIVWGTKKANRKKGGKYTGSHIEGGYVVSGMKLKALFHENFNPELQPLRQEQRKESTERLLKEMYQEETVADSVKSVDYHCDFPSEGTKDVFKESTGTDPGIDEEVNHNQVYKFQYRVMTSEEEKVFGSSKPVQAVNSASGEKLEFQNPMRAFTGMHAYIDHDDYSPTSVTLQLLGADVDIHGNWVFQFDSTQDL